MNPVRFDKKGMIEISSVNALSTDEMRTWIYDRLHGRDVTVPGGAADDGMPHYLFSLLYLKLDRSIREDMHLIILEFLRDLAQDPKSNWLGTAGAELLLLIEPIMSQTRYTEEIFDLLLDITLKPKREHTPLHFQALQALVALRFRADRKFWHEQYWANRAKGAGYAPLVLEGLSIIGISAFFEFLTIAGPDSNLDKSLFLFLPSLLQQYGGGRVLDSIERYWSSLPSSTRRVLIEYCEGEGIGFPSARRGGRLRRSAKGRQGPLSAPKLKKRRKSSVNREHVGDEERTPEGVAREEGLENLEPRAPVVTVMGHVDRGETSLLDAIRESKVEARGITHHIGASEVHIGERKVVFIDTPGHEAFTRMRARGAKVTDIVVLVVAADDGVMPQTQEAIDHAKAAGVPIVVAINKIDKPEAQPERVKRQLSERGLMPEEWGGDTMMVEVSARQKTNLNKLLEMLLLVADLRELKANAKGPGAGTVLESRVDKVRGPLATVLVQTGTLNIGDVFIVGAVYGRALAMFDDRGHFLRSAGPSTPVEVLGLQGVPEAGEQFQVTDEARARHIVEFRQNKLREASLAESAGARITLDRLHEQLRAGEVKELSLVIKADVQGAVEVLSEMLPKLSDDRVKLKIIRASIGTVTENDVLLALASSAIIVAFNVWPDRKASDLAQREGVEIRPHSVIYEVSDEIKKAMTGLLEPVFKETHMGRAEVRATFRIKGVGMIAGCYVLDGVLKRDAEVRVLRDGVVTYTGRISSLRRFKDDVNEVRSGFECGVILSQFNDFKVGDVIECVFRVPLQVVDALANIS